MTSPVRPLQCGRQHSELSGIRDKSTLTNSVDTSVRSSRIRSLSVHLSSPRGFGSFRERSGFDKWMVIGLQYKVSALLHIKITMPLQIITGAGFLNFGCSQWRSPKTAENISSRVPNGVSELFTLFPWDPDSPNRFLMLAILSVISLDNVSGLQTS